jgi:hypothetical protein
VGSITISLGLPIAFLFFIYSFIKVIFRFIRCNVK